MAAHLEVLPTRLHDLDRAADGALGVLHPEADDRVGDGLLGQRAGRLPVHRRGLDRQQGREPLALQPLGEHVECRARVAGAVGAEEPGHAVDEDTPRADGRGFLQQDAVGLLQLLPQDVAGGEHDLEPALLLQPAKVPAQPLGIAHELVRGDLEHDDDPGLAELARASVHELDAHRRLAGADRALQQYDVAPRDAAGQDVIQPGDAGPDRVEITR
jgi:hypothetical protein